MSENPVVYKEYLMPVLEKILAAKREPAKAGAEAGGST
jgi:hypothetical protein